MISMKNPHIFAIKIFKSLFATPFTTQQIALINIKVADKIGIK
jgi:hypothetical protein